MKKKKIKAIRLLAARLPKSYVLRMHTASMSGVEVLHHKIPSEQHIELTELYRVTKEILEPINHTQRLKRVYSKRGDVGIYEYMIWVNENNIRLNRLLGPKDQVDLLDEGLLGVINKGAQGFWRNLINFLFSFLTVFKKQPA